MKYLILIWALIGLSACATIRNSTSRNISPQASETPITDRTYGEDMLNQFVECREANNSDRDCDNKFTEMYSLRLAREYPNADIQDVVSWCKSEPLICGFDTIEKAKQLELKMSESQDSYEVAASNSKTRSTIGAFLKGFGEGMSNKNRVDCVSTGNAYVVHTSCK